MYLDGCQWIINAQMFIKCNFIYVDNFPPKTSFVCVCLWSCALSFHTHALTLAPSALFIALFCLSTFTGIPLFNQQYNSVNLFFPPQWLCCRCVGTFFVWYKIIPVRYNGVMAAAMVVVAVAAATMMVYVWPINNTRINIECRLKLDWTQRVASEKETHTHKHTPRKRVFTHKQKQWQ